jgi:hypothetical protein
MKKSIENLETLLAKNVKSQAETVNITIRNEKNEVLITQKMKLSDFKGGIKTFAKITNNITLRWYDEPLNITINSIEIKFFGGKFASNVRKIVNCYLDSQTFYKTENVNEIRKELRQGVYNFLDSNCDNILQVVELIKFIEKTPVKQLANVVLNTNFKVIENE